MGTPASGARRGAAAWLFPLLLVLVGIVVLLLLLSRCGSGSDTSNTGATTSPSPSSVPSVTASPESTPSPSQTEGGSGGGTGTITAGGATVLPLTGSSTGSLSQYSGETAKTTSVSVQSVPADEGFWVGASDSDRVWVQLTGKAGESPYKVKTGDSVTFTGKIVKNSTGFADSVGVTAKEGKSQLDAQGYHIDAPKASLKLAS